MNPIPVANARKIISKYGLKFPRQYSLEEILNAEKLYLREVALEGIAGAIVFNGKNGIITIDTNITDRGRKNFTIAHEFGHYCNEGNKIQVCKDEDILSIKVDDEREVDANLFASEFLMPGDWIAKFLKGEKLNRETLYSTADAFEVSLSATVMRIAMLDLYPCAFAMCSDRKVKWSIISKSFKYSFIPIGKKVSELSCASDFFRDSSSFIAGEEKIYTRAWFDEDFKFKDQLEMINELIIPFPLHNSGIVLLW